jgi:hypothetical protein
MSYRVSKRRFRHIADFVPEFKSVTRKDLPQHKIHLANYPGR